MIIIRTVSAVRDAVRSARARGERIGLVPTMGAFHDGHRTIMRRAAEHNDCVIVSLFVNPAQFNEAIDLERYPRHEQRDAEIAASAGVSVLFAPAVSEVYPNGFVSSVEVAALAAPLEGEVRGAQHFRGVATVVAKLLNMIQPDDVFFGQKDAQQALILQCMAQDLNFPVRVEICPTVREPDGLAMSSRNALLDADARRRAPALFQALFAVTKAVEGGETRSTHALAAGRLTLAAHAIVPEYFSAVSMLTLEPVDQIREPTLIAIAARLGTVRLIDNVVVGASGWSQ